MRKYKQSYIPSEGISFTASGCVWGAIKLIAATVVFCVVASVLCTEFDSIFK
jgi:hypothetical protein